MSTSDHSRRWTRGQTIADALSDQAIVHNGSLVAPLERGPEAASAVVRGRVARTGPLRVQTPPTQWAYALELPVDGPRLSEAGGPVLVDVELEVEHGLLGVGALSLDRQRFTSAELPVGPDAGRTTVTVLLKEPEDCSALMLRNIALDGTVTHVTLFSATPSRAADRWSPSVDSSEADRKTDIAAATPATLFSILRRKWSEVPGGLLQRRRSVDLLQLSDDALLDTWRAVRDEASAGSGFPVRGWYMTLYRDVLAGRRVMDVGSGMGIDGLTFAEAGAAVTFVDIAPDNLRVIRRLAGIMGLRNVGFVHLENFDTIDSLPTVDVIWAQGSMINAPFSLMQEECRRLLKHLPVGGRWIELAYPPERWVREGRRPFSEWGVVTDGPGTPWMEWYDLERLQARLQPAVFDPVTAFNFHNDDFVWFDLLRRA